MHGRMITGVAWVSFPCETAFRWWFATTNGEARLILQHGDDAPLIVPVDQERALDIVHLLGKITNDVSLQAATGVDSALT